jgi:hypothetical protein
MAINCGAGLCSVCGAPASTSTYRAQSPTSEEDLPVLSFCEIHSPRNNGSIEVLENSLDQGLRSMMTESSGSMERARFEFVVKGSSDDIIKFNKDVKQLSFETYLFDQVVGPLNQKVLRCLSTWFSTIKPESDTHLLIFSIVNLCSVHNCECVGHGIQGRLRED